MYSLFLEGVVMHLLS